VVTQFCIKKLKDTNQKNLHLAVDSTNINAISLYVKCGFKTITPVSRIKFKNNFINLNEVDFLNFFNKNKFNFKIEDLKIDNLENFEDVIKLSDKLIGYNNKKYFEDLKKNNSYFNPVVFKIKNDIVGFSFGFGTQFNTLIDIKIYLFCFLKCFLEKRIDNNYLIKLWRACNFNLL
jgi:hypothetical protein